MSVLLNVREWLSISEVEDYLKLKVVNNTGVAKTTFQDMVPLIYETQIPVYWRADDYSWINLGADYHHFYNTPVEHFLTGKQQLKKYFWGEELSGYLQLDLDVMGIFESDFVDYLHGNPFLLNICGLVAISPTDEKSRVTTITREGRIYKGKLQYESMERKTLFKTLVFKRVDIDKLIDLAIVVTADADKPIVPKAENSYLRLIQALAEYVTNGLTGKPSTDANAIEAALRSKGIDCPLDNKTLTNYLKKARELSK